MKVKANAFLHWRKYEWEQAGEYTLNSCDMSKESPEYVLIRKMDIDVDVPDDFDPRPQQIQTLKAVKAEILAKAHVQAQNIEEQIQRLLCIEHKPGAA